ncbi:MAG: Ig-like domain-containing protein [Clostridia bacterium]|nr:Ig-like domain-containing protein [Clostridia bacterium]
MFSILLAVMMLFSGASVLSAPVADMFSMQASAAAVSLNKTTLTLKSGKNFVLKLNYGTIKSAKSSKTAVATVTNTGKITAKNAGKTTITVTSTKGQTFKCVVTVTPWMNASRALLAKGDAKVLKVYGANIKAVKSSKVSVVAVASTGKMVAKGAGKATVTVTDTLGNVYKCAVTVEDPSLSKTSLSLRPGKTAALELENNTQGVVWTTGNKAIATVSSAGKAGKTTVTATVDSGHKYKCTVKVIAYLNYTTLKLAKGDSKMILLTGAVAKTFKSSNTAVATVSALGKITAKAKGTATITVIDENGNAYTCKVTVEAPTISKSVLTVKYGKTATLKLNNNTQSVTWSSSNTNVATVNSAGKITAKKVGTAVITAKVASGKKYTCDLTVVAYLNYAALPLFLGEEANLTLKGAVAETYKSSKPSVASVDSEGLVTALGIGTATITVTDTKGKNYICKVTVTAPEISDNEIHLQVGETYDLSIKGNTSKLVIWGSSKKAVAKFVTLKDSVTGVVTALSPGTTTVTAYVVSLASAKVTLFTCKVVVGDAENCTVDFYTDGGSEVASQTVSNGCTAARPADPTKTGCTFAGWYADREFTQLYNFNTPVTQNIVLFAKWECAAIDNAGTISGKICKASDRATAIANASIKIYKNTTLVKTVTSNAEGNYSTQVAAGTYKVKITATGYIEFNAYVTVTENETTYTETYLMISGNPTSTGIATGKVINSLDNTGVAGVTLKVRSGWNNTSSSAEIVKTATTASDGTYSLTLNLGNYTVVASKSGFTTATFNIVVQEGTTGNQDGIITPIVSGNDYLITLTWGENPRDLDSHVVGTLANGNRFHTYYAHMSDTDGSVEVCSLDYDDVTSYGPEHITLKATNDKPYYYYVYRYAGIGTVATSGAKVIVNQGNNVIATFNVPTDLGSGDYWNIFCIKNGQLIIRNTMTSTAETNYAD